MSQQIDQAFVEQFTSNVFHLSQQKGSRLRDKVRNESQKGNTAFYERIGAVVAQKKVSRHSDTPQVDTPHTRRRVSLEDYEHADLIDKVDRIRILIDPESNYSMAFMWAFGRAIDDEIISAADGTAYAGQNGSTSVVFPNSQKVGATDGVSATNVNLNVNTLRIVKQVFDENDVDESIMRHFAIGSSQLKSLLEETEVQSADFNTIRALVAGELNTYMGFNFTRIERLLTLASADVFDKDTGRDVGVGGDTIAAGSRRCLAWAEDGMLLSIGQDPMGRIQERADKSFSTQVFMSMSLGATRLEEEKVVQVLCNES